MSDRPSRRRVVALMARLREVYGRPVAMPHHDPVGELVLTILSQSTNDRNRDVAFRRLRARFGDWAAVRDAPQDEVVEAIRPGGLAQQKGPRIQQVLAGLGPGTDLDWLAEAPREEAIGFLCSLPGVGRKTAACVQMFSFGYDEVPVDTHVHRTAGRLGLFPEGLALERAHDRMHALARPGEGYELHLNLIRHGRRVCRPDPRCEGCAVRRMCPWWRAHRSPSAEASATKRRGRSTK